MADAKPQSPARRTVTRKAHWIEWATGIIAAIIVGSMTVWIAYHAVTAAGGTPVLSIRIVDRQSVGNGYRVSFVVENSGTRTASAVPVTGELKDGDRVIETKDVTFDYVPAQSSASGALLFTIDPSTHVVDISASGYVDP